MDRKTKSGCITAAVLSLALILGFVVVIAMFAYRGVHKGKEFAVERAERLMEQAAKAAEEREASEPVKLVEGELPDYSDYQAGSPLSREVYLAWKLDAGTTSLVKETFRSRADGAPVTWLLQTSDLHEDDGVVIGQFYLPYRVEGTDGVRQQVGVEHVRCEFAGSEKNTLLDIRRGTTVAITGTLELADGHILIRDARRADAPAVEKE